MTLKSKRPILGVIAAVANGIEQRQILNGFVAEAQSHGFDTAVFSNLYNPHITVEDLKCEQRIYELAGSEQISGYILITESFINPDMRRFIAGILKGRNVPLVLVGSMQEEFDFADISCINTSDENDIYNIVTHLVEEHGYRHIDLLTGFADNKISHRRADGFMRALRDHGIPVGEDNIIFGDFWFTGGEKLADEYISGIRPMPRAVVCASDYMAYGLLDRLSEKGVNVPDDIAVIGYENVMQRIYHSPLLTTYQRNRHDLGICAFHTLYSKIKGQPEPEFTPPAGRLIPGHSCGCRGLYEDFNREQRLVREQKKYENWNMFSSMDQRLTTSRNLTEFIANAGEHQWLIRYVQNIYLCLFTDWCDSASSMSENVSCRSIMPWNDTAPFELNKYDLAGIFAKEQSPSVFYFTPLFFGQRLFGHLVLRYDNPDTYDEFFRSWIKSVTNGLEILRMKNDIQYLTSCQNLSDQRDTLTGMYNEDGIKKAFSSAVTPKNKDLYLVVLRIGLFDESITSMDNADRIDAVLSAAKAVGKFCGNHDICGRVSDNTFVCIVQTSADAETLTGTLSALLIRHKKYMERYGMDSFVCAAEKYDGSSYTELYERCSEDIAQSCAELSEKRLLKHYREMLELRNYIYSNPEATFDTDDICSSFSGSSGYLKAIYKQCFGISLHQDCIAARILRAKYYLVTTSLNMADIADKCSYTDSKYFLRQFYSATGLTAAKYRSMIQG